MLWRSMWHFIILLNFLAGGRPPLAERQAAADQSRLTGSAPYGAPYGAPHGGDRRWEDEIIYVVILSKFHNGDPSNDIMMSRYGKEIDRYEGGYLGGDLAGVIQKLDYLQELGITTLFLYPVMQNDRSAVGKYLSGGYRPCDYFQVDENLGDMKALQDLVRQAQGRGMRVILDMPLLFPGFEHPLNTNESFEKGLLGALSRYGVRQWNAENPEMADYLIKVGKFWRDQTGCDGFRLDTANQHSTGFWKRFADEMRAGAPKSDFFLMAELAVPPRRIGEFLRETGFDSAYDFSSLIAQNVFGEGHHVGRIAFVQKEANQYYPNPLRMCGEIDNYDMEPFLHRSLEPKAKRMELALAYLLTNNRIPILYLGDEAALTFNRPGELFDPARRNESIFTATQELIALRRHHPALRRGELVEVLVEDPVYAFVRKYHGERLLILFNKSDEPREVRLSIEEIPWIDADLENLRKGGESKPAGSDAPLPLGPLEAAIYSVRSGNP